VGSRSQPSRAARSGQWTEVFDVLGDDAPSLLARPDEQLLVGHRPKLRVGGDRDHIEAAAAKLPCDYRREHLIE